MTTGFDGVFPADVPVGFVEDVLATRRMNSKLLWSNSVPITLDRGMVWLNNPRNAP